MWELAHEEGWTPKNRCFWTGELEKTLESPVDCQESQQVTPKANQTWIFTAKTDAEAPILWPPDVKDWLIGKEPDAGEDWRQEEKGTTEDELVGWHQWLDGHEPEQARGVGDGQRSLVCCSPWGRNGSDTERLNWLTGTVARVGSRIRPLTQKWNHTLVSAALQVPKARRACSSAQRKKSVAFSGTATLRADFPRTRKSEDNGLTSVKCWKTNNHQPGILYSTKILFESESKIETLRANGNETTHHPHTCTKKILRQCFGKKKSSLWRKYKKQVETNNEVTVRVNINSTKQWC